MQNFIAGILTLASAAPLFAAAEGSAGGVRWIAPARWQVAAARPMRAATYTVPAAGGAEAGECGVFFFGKGKGGSVEDNFVRWEKQFEGLPASKRSEKTVHGFKVHILDVSGTYLASAGPMMPPQEKKAGWRLLGAIIEAPEGLVFFKCTGPQATVKAAEKEFEALVDSVGPATAKA